MLLYLIFIYLVDELSLDKIFTLPPVGIVPNKLLFWLAAFLILTLWLVQAVAPYKVALKLPIFAWATPFLSK